MSSVRTMPSVASAEEQSYQREAEALVDRACAEGWDCTAAGTVQVREHLRIAKVVPVRRSCNASGSPAVLMMAAAGSRSSSAPTARGEGGRRCVSVGGRGVGITERAAFRDRRRATCARPGFEMILESRRSC